ncbi:hypothetical protein WS69_00650 [Burkholderia sp. BDU5]|nr:hypothetical protein WS69_00650 [Burkholderia sp. BDU5]
MRRVGGAFSEGGAKTRAEKSRPRQASGDERSRRGERGAKAKDVSDMHRRRAAPFISRETGCERFAEINGIASTRAAGATKTRASPSRARRC